MSSHLNRNKMVGYLRTSTDDQLLGIDAQRETLHKIIRAKPGHIIDEIFTEHESGGNNARPELDRAFRRARRIKGYVCVAKLDRLARDQAFLMQLIDSGVPIVFGDLPEVDFNTAEGRLNLQIFGAFAEFERRRIGARTREALRILKGQGVKLGAARPECRKLSHDARARGAKVAARNRTRKAIEDQSDIASIALELKQQGHSLRHIAAHLNAEGYPTRDGSEFDPQTGKGGWTATQVWRVLKRIGVPTG
jgi:DNA invertase Pin-like site-specific DNA recombinase